MGADKSLETQPSIPPPSQDKRSVTDILQSIQADGKIDGKIDGKDRKDFDELLKRFKEEKGEILEKTKVSLRKSLETSLKDGYTLKDESDYDMLRKILEFLNSNFQLQNISKEAFEAHTKKQVTFSVVLDNVSDLYIYNENKIFDGEGHISLLTGAFEKGSTLSVDDRSNNNLIDLEDVKAIAQGKTPLTPAEKRESERQRVVQEFAPPAKTIETIIAESLTKNVEKAQQALDEAKRALDKAQQAAEEAIQASRREKNVEKAQQAAEKTQQALDTAKNVEKAQQALDEAKRALDKAQQATSAATAEIARTAERDQQTQEVMTQLQLNPDRYKILMACLGDNLEVNGKLNIDIIRGRIRELQTTLGLTADGKPGEQLFARLEYNTTLSHLTPSDKAQAQKYIQTYFAKGIDITSPAGKLELATRVRAFQQKEGIPVNGMIDTTTLGKMKEKLATVNSATEEARQAAAQAAAEARRDMAKTVARGAEAVRTIEAIEQAKQESDAEQLSTEDQALLKRYDTKMPKEMSTILLPHMPNGKFAIAEIKKIQENIGVTADGKPGRETLETLKYVNRLNPESRAIAADFASKTGIDITDLVAFATATCNFQRQHGLSADGKFGGTTIAKYKEVGFQQASADTSRETSDTVSNIPQKILDHLNAIPSPVDFDRDKVHIDDIYAYIEKTYPDSELPTNIGPTTKTEAMGDAGLQYITNTFIEKLKGGIRFSRTESIDLYFGTSPIFRDTALHYDIHKAIQSGKIVVMKHTDTGNIELKDGGTVIGTYDGMWKRISVGDTTPKSVGENQPSSDIDRRVNDVFGKCEQLDNDCKRRTEERLAKEVKHNTHTWKNPEDVKIIQRAVGEKETGVFTNETIKKIVIYQHEKGLKIDGAVGPQVISAIHKQLGIQLQYDMQRQAGGGKTKRTEFNVSGKGCPEG